MVALILVKGLLRRREKEKRNLGEITSWENSIKTLCSQGREIKPRPKQHEDKVGSGKLEGSIPTVLSQPGSLSVAAPSPRRMCESPVGTPYHWSGRRDGA